MTDSQTWYAFRAISMLLEQHSYGNLVLIATTPIIALSVTEITY